MRLLKAHSSRNRVYTPRMYIVYCIVCARRRRNTHYTLHNQCIDLRIVTTDGSCLVQSFDIGSFHFPVKKSLPSVGFFRGLLTHAMKCVQYSFQLRANTNIKPSVIYRYIRYSQTAVVRLCTQHCTHHWSIEPFPFCDRFHLPGKGKFGSNQNENVFRNSE